MSTVSAEIYRFGGFTLDLGRGCLREGEREIKLRPKSFEVLTCLVRNAGRLLSKDELMQAAWPNIFVSDDSLVQCIKDIRRALGESAQLSIRTVPGRGYIFDLPVSLAEPAALAPSAPPLARARLRRFDAVGRRTIPMTAVALVLVSGGLGWWLLSPSPPDTPEASPIAAAPPPRLSIVVLPFANLSDDPEQEYFADGLTDNLTTDLSTHISGLLVIARNSAFTFKGKNVDVTKVARDLGVRYVLEGSVQRGGNQIRVNIQLVDAQSGTHLWATHFEGERGELFALEGRITGDIANSLGIQLIQAAARDAELHKSDPNAADLVMRGRAVLRQPESFDNLTEAATLFRHALTIDDQNVDALAGLAQALIARLINFSDQEAAERDGVVKQANDAAERAVTLDHESAVAHYAKGFVLRAQRRNLEAAQEYKIAIARDPNYAQAYSNLGATMFRLGQPEKAIPLIEQAMRLSPRDPVTGLFDWQLGTAHLFLRHDDLAIEWFLKAHAANPKYVFVLRDLAAAYALKGDDERAQAYLAELLKAWPNVSIASQRANRDSDDPEYLRLREETLYAGLRKAGVPEK
jgi:adenylate cyclase